MKSCKAFLAMFVLMSGCALQWQSAAFGQQRRSAEQGRTDPGPTDRDRKRDEWQRPAEVLEALGVKPGHRVADIGSGYGYRTQYLAASLRPSAAYPFPDGATLVRGRVLAGAAPLPGATVKLVNVPDLPGPKVRREKDQQYRTGEDGEFVLFFPEVIGARETFTLRASHSARPDVDRDVEVRRGMTVATNIVMAA